MSEQIKRAIEWLERENYYIGSRVGECIQTQVYELSIQALQSELERQENKPLTLSELKEMVGEPVWVAWENGTFCHIVDEFDYKKDMLIFTEDFASITLIKKGVTKIYKHKPTEGVGR